MKAKSILVAFLILVALVVVSKLVINSVDAIAKTGTVNQPVITPTNHETQFSIVEGANNPELISDRIAYTMVFRLLSSHKNDAELRRLRGYVQQNLGITDDNEIEAIFQIANEHKYRTLPIDSQMGAIKDRYHPSHSAYSSADRKRLEKLKKDKDKIVNDLIADIPGRLGESGKVKLHQSIRNHVRQRIRAQ